MNKENEIYKLRHKLAWFIILCAAQSFVIIHLLTDKT